MPKGYLRFPDGTKIELYSVGVIADVIVKKDIYVVADEMYEYLTYDGAEHISIASLNDEIYKRTITCSGVSKSYAMTGWRIGYTGSSVEIAKLMSSVQSHQTSNANSIAQKATLEALTGPQDAMNAMTVEFDKRRRYMYNRVCKLPFVSALEPKGAFYVFIDVSEALKKEYKGEKVATSTNLAKILIEEFNVAVIPCPDFGAPEYIRLSYAIAIEQIEKGIDRIENFLHALK